MHRGGGGVVALQLVGVGVDPGETGGKTHVPVEGGDLRQPTAEGEQPVAPVEGRLARGPGQQPTGEWVVLGDHATRHGIGEDRRAEPGRERKDDRFPIGQRTAHEHRRAFGRREKLDDRIDGGRRVGTVDGRRARADLVHDRPHRPLGRGRRLEHGPADQQLHRPGRRGDRLGERSGDDGVDLVGTRDPESPLDDRGVARLEVALVHLGPPVALVEIDGEHHHRHAIGQCHQHARRAVQRTGSGHHAHDRRPARHLGVGGGRVGGTGLVAVHDHAHRRFVGERVVQAQRVDTGDAEHHPGAAGGQRSDEDTGGRRRHRCRHGGGHGREF